jgi:hypothetical protein
MIFNGWIYYSHYDDQRLYRVSTDGGEAQLVNECDTYNLIIKSGWLYYQNWSATKAEKDEGIPMHFVGIHKMRPDGSEHQILVDGSCCEDSGYAIDEPGEWLYFSNSEDDYSLYKIRTDGSELKKVDNDNSRQIKVTDEWVYYIKRENDADNIYRMRRKTND